MRVGSGKDLVSDKDESDDDEYIPDEGLPALCVLTIYYRDTQWLVNNSVIRVRQPLGDSNGTLWKPDVKRDLSTPVQLGSEISMFSSPAVPANRRIDFSLLQSSPVAQLHSDILDSPTNAIFSSPINPTRLNKSSLCRTPSSFAAMDICESDCDQPSMEVLNSSMILESISHDNRDSTATNLDGVSDSAKSLDSKSSTVVDEALAIQAILQISNKKSDADSSTSDQTLTSSTKPLARQRIPIMFYTSRDVNANVLTCGRVTHSQSDTPPQLLDQILKIMKILLKERSTRKYEV